ncbi:hypothetical protein ACFX1X_017649 [Malus domestica]|uniref:NADP-dependent alkenal double bond reductase P2-like n=1 Tax=Malus domestica TaxID=3750 RepID=UPI000498B7A7
MAASTKEVISNKQVVLTLPRDHVTGFPKESDMQLTTTTTKLKLPEGSKGVSMKNLHLYCDPCMRGRMTKHEPGTSYVDSFNADSVNHSSNCLTKSSSTVFNSPVDELLLQPNCLS